MTKSTEISKNKATGIAVKFLVYRYSNQDPLSLDRTPDWMSGYWYTWYANYETNIYGAIADAMTVVKAEWPHAVFKETTHY